MRKIGPVALLIGLAISGRGVAAKDYSEDWRFLGIIQPELRLLPGAEPDFRWRRLRAVAHGPLSADAKARIQVNFNTDTQQLSLLDAVVQWDPVRGRTSFGVQAGLHYPNWAADAQIFPDTVMYPYAITQARLFNRTAGAQVHFGFLGNHRVSLGVFNGPQNFSFSSERPIYFSAFTSVQPKFDAKIWYLTGYDPAAGGQTRTDLLGMELVRGRLGNFGGETSFLVGQRYGREFIGGYTQIDYRFLPEQKFLVRHDWADLNRDAPNTKANRVFVGYVGRWAPWMVSKLNTEFDLDDGRISGYLQGDIRF